MRSQSSRPFEGLLHRWMVPVILGSLVFAVAFGCRGVAWAAGGSSDDSAELKQQVLELQQEIKELKGEIKVIKTEAEVKAPAAPAGGTATAAAPQTFGEHLGAVEKDVADLKKNLTDNLGVHIHGLVDTSYDYNINEPNTSLGSNGGPNPIAPGGRVNQLRAFDTNANGFELEQFNLHIDRTQDGGVGLVTDINFGQVANVMGASTRYSNTNTAANSTTNTTVDLTQAYMTYTAPVGSGINLSLGRFVTLLGEEVIPVYNNQNFNESRGFLFTLGEPLTHTGLRANYAINDKMGVTLGVNNGWDDVSDNNMGQTIEGQFAMNSGDMLGSAQSVAFTLSGIFGPEQVNHGNSKLWALDPIVTYKTPVKGLQLIAEYLYAQQTAPVSASPAYSSQGNRFCYGPTATTPLCTPAPGFTSAPYGQVNIPNQVSWTGAAGYIVYDLNDNVQLASRGEWFRDSDGSRSGLRQTLGEFTQTLTYKVPNVSGLIGRLEYRHDESGQKPFFSNELYPATAANVAAGIAGLPAHTYAGQDTLMADAIYSF